MQKYMPIMAKWWRSKLEVEFQYGGRFFFKTWGSYISAVNSDMSTKFGLLINIDLLKAATSTNTKPEVVFSGSSCHLNKWIWRHISTCAPISTKFSTCRLWRTGRDQNWKQNSNMADVCFSKTEVVTSQPSIQIGNEIWFADRLCPSQGSDINKYETGSSI